MYVDTLHNKLYSFGLTKNIRFDINSDNGTLSNRVNSSSKKPNNGKDFYHSGVVSEDGKTLYTTFSGRKWAPNIDDAFFDITIDITKNESKKLGLSPELSATLSDDDWNHIRGITKYAGYIYITNGNAGIEGSAPKLNDSMVAIFKEPEDSDNPLELVSQVKISGKSFNGGIRIISKSLK